MVLRKLANGELIQIQLSNGGRYAVVYGVGWKIRVEDVPEIFAELDVLCVDEAKILTDDKIVIYSPRE